METTQIKEEFLDGIDCGQVVLSHFAPKLGLSDETAKRIASPFGAGMFDARICGAVVGAYLVLGLKYGHDAKNQGDKKNTLVQKMRAFDAAFLEKHDSLTCKELLGYDISDEEEKAVILEKGLLFDFCPAAVRDAIEILEAMGV